MGLRDKVALALVSSFVITQITIGYCMPSSQRKAYLRQYIDNLNQGKSNPVSRSTCPTKIIKTIIPKSKNDQFNNERISEKSIYKAFNFPETDYGFDTTRKNPFYLKTGFTSNRLGAPNKELVNPQSEKINNLRKEMRMKRKQNSNNNNYLANAEMPSFTEFSANLDFLRLKDKSSFPAVQYPTNAMETWIPHYWNNPSFYTTYDRKYTDCPVYDPKASEDTTIFYDPYKQKIKCKTKQFVQQIEKFKEKVRVSSCSAPTKPSVTSNPPIGGLIKSDSNPSIVSSADMAPTVNNKKQAISPTKDEDKNLENTRPLNNCGSLDASSQLDTMPMTSKVCSDPDVIQPVSNNSNVTPAPIPYKDIDKNNMCSAYVDENVSRYSNTEECAKSSSSESINNNFPQELEKDCTCNTCNCSAISNDNTSEDNSQTQPTKTSPELSSNEVPTSDTPITSDTENSTDYTIALPVRNGSGASSTSTDPAKEILPVPTDSTSNNTMPECIFNEDVKQEPIDKVPYTSVFIVPVGNSISKIQLPIVESNTGAPIIVIVPSMASNEKPTMSSPNTTPLELVRASNAALCNVSANSTSYEPLKINTITCEMCSNTQSTPIEYIFEIPSTGFWTRPDFEMLPDNSMCYASTEPVKNHTSLHNDTNSSGTSIPENTPNTGSSKEEIESTPIVTNNNDTYVQNNPYSPDTSLPGNTTGTRSNEEPTNTSLKYTDNNESSETSSTKNTTESVLNAANTENTPADTKKNGENPGDDTCICPTKTSTPVNSTDGGINEDPDSSLPNIPTDSGSNKEPTSTPNNTIDTEPKAGEAQTIPTDSSKKNTSLPNDDNPSVTSEPDNTTDSEPNEEQTTITQTGACKNANYVCNDTTFTYTGPNKEQAETTPADTGKNDISASNNTNSSESTIPSNNSTTAPNKEEWVSIPTVNNDTSTFNDSDSSANSGSQNVTDAGLGKEKPQIFPVDKNGRTVQTNPLATSPPGNTTNTGPENEQTKTAPNDPSNTTNYGPNNVQAEEIPTKSTKNNTSEPNDTIPTNTAVNDDSNKDTSAPNITNSSDPPLPDSTSQIKPNDGSNETEPSDPCKNNTIVSEDTNNSKSSSSNNSIDSKLDKEQAETAPPANNKDNKPVSNDTNPAETSPTDNADKPELNKDLQDMQLLQDKDLSENIKTVVPDMKELENVQQPIMDNTLPADISKGLPDNPVSDTVSAGDLPFTSPIDNVDNLGLEKGLADTPATNIIKNDKSLPGDTELPLSLLTANTLPTGIGLPLSMMAENPKISELDKRLADAPDKVNNKSDMTIPKDLEMIKDNTKDVLDKNLMHSASAQNDVGRDDKKITIAKTVAKTLISDDSKKAESDKGSSKQIKSKFVYTYRSHSNAQERLRQSDVAVTNKIKDDNPLKMHIELPLASIELDNKKRRTDTSPVTKLTTDKINQDKLKFSNDDAKKSSKIAQNPSVNDNTSMALLIDEKPRLKKKQPSDINGLLKDKVVDNSPTLRKVRLDGDPSNENTSQPQQVAKKLTSAELKDIIKYIYMSL